MISISLEHRKSLKLCPKCSSEMALVWNQRVRSENAYAPERMHMLICTLCGYGRTERFVDIEVYPLLAQYDSNNQLTFRLNDGKDILSRPIDAATIARAE